MKPSLPSAASISPQLINQLQWLFLFIGFPFLAFPQFGPENVITTCEVCMPADMYVADLTGDGLLDVLSASFVDDKIAWYENLGGGSFPSQYIITTEADHAWAVHAADIDGDGDQDVVSASRADDKIAWYENQFPISATIQAEQVNFLGIHPNPAAHEVTLTFQDVPEGHYSINLYDELGRHSYHTNLPVSHQEVITLDWSHLNRGTYTLILLHEKSGDMFIRRVVMLR